MTEPNDANGSSLQPPLGSCGAGPDTNPSSSPETEPFLPSGEFKGSPYVLFPGFRPLTDYLLVKKLGRGGFGEVWQANGPGGVPVALKFIHLGDHAGRLELRSLEFMKGVRHPHLVGIHGTWLQDNLLILAMELGDGTLSDTLKHALGKGEHGIPRAQLREFMLDAAGGIDYLNSVGIQHRDVKPQNLLLIGGSVKVTDFGLAKVLQDTRTSNSGSMTPAYAAPEFFRGQTSNQSDQYSLAVTYCHLRGGRLPFQGNHAQLMMGHLQGSPDLTMVPEAEGKILSRALAKNPSDRWPTCREFIGTLTSIPDASIQALQETAIYPLQEKEGNSIPVSFRQASRSRNLICVSLAFGLLIGIILLALSWSHIPRMDEHPEGQLALPESVSPPSHIGSNELALDLGDGVTLELVRVKAGKFMMGAPDSDPEVWEHEKPQREVELDHDFYLGKYSVTQEQFQRVCGWNPSWFSKDGGGQDKVAGLETKRFPVEQVTPKDALDFCRRLQDLTQRKCALPTEAQWEYACRAGSRTSYNFGNGSYDSKRRDIKELDDFAWYASNSDERTHEVGTKESNAWRLFDMHGNVGQWCADKYIAPVEKNNSPILKPSFLGPDEGSEDHYVRGGSFHWVALRCRSYSRDSGRYAIKWVGFRVLVEVD